ncbi:MAG TPA: preprotein translocase subunit YajC [Steroidobacteraceae bacterium]|jgi:preprotein translocase subunit YajC|nr:preprotein translocase subunit YajC [Steroidobacteraceae bacterium]
MSFLIENAWAQGAAPGQPGGMINFVILMGLFFAIFYFMLIRPQSKRAKEHRAMLSALATGDEVVTSGGILGRITEIGDNFITVEVADGVRLKIQKGQVSGLMPKGTFKSA